MLSKSFGPTETIIDYTSSKSGQYGESFFPVGLEVYIDSNADVDSDVGAETEPKLDDLAYLATVAGAEDQEEMVVGMEQPLHMNVDNRAP